MNDERKRAEFAELVHAVERATAEATRPWRIACGLLAVALAVVVCWRRK